MTPNRRSRTSVALVAAVGTLVLGGAASAVAADLAPGLEKDGMFRNGAFAQDAAPSGSDLVSAAVAAMRGAAGEPSARFAAAESDAIAAAAALLSGAQEASAGAFAGETDGFGRLRSVAYGGEGGLMANSDLSPNIRPTNPARNRGSGRFAAANHPVLAAIAAAKGWFGGDARFAAPVEVGAFDSLRGIGTDGRFKTDRLPVNAEGYDALREVAGDVGAQAASGLMSDAAFAGALDPAAIRNAASYVTGGRLGYSAPLSGLAALPAVGQAAFAADADAGIVARLRQAAASFDNGFSVSIGTGIATGEDAGASVDPGLRQPDFGMSGDAAEAMRDLVGQGT